MSDVKTRSLRPLAPIALLWVGAGIVYGLSGATPSAVIVVGSYVSLLVAAGMWLEADAQLYRRSLVFDWGLALFVAWPVLLPFHAYRTRGRAGWRLAIVLLGAMFARQIGTVVGYVLSAFSV